MARINIDDELRADPRFHELCRLVPRHEAYGALICLWDLGQAYWKRKKSRIPRSTAEALPKLTELIQTGFAVAAGDFIYCSGAEERWSFLIQRSEAGAKGGKKSAESRLKKYGSSIPINATNAEANRSKPNHSSSSSSLEEEIHTASSQDEPAKIRSKSKKPKPSFEGLNFDFDAVYARYPKRKGNQPGLARKLLSKQLKTQQDADDFTRAVENYAADCRATKRDEQYIKRIEYFVLTKGEMFWMGWVNVSPIKSLTEQRIQGVGW